MLDLNITILFQLVNFFVALYVLNLLLIRPIRSILQERRAKMAGLTGDADAFTREADERLASYEANLALARQESAAERAKTKGEAMAEQQNLLADAGKNAQQQLQQAQAAIKAEADAALAQLRTQVSAMADQLGAKVLG